MNSLSPGELSPSRMMESLALIVFFFWGGDARKLKDLDVFHIPSHPCMLDSPLAFVE